MRTQRNHSLTSALATSSMAAMFMAMSLAACGGDDTMEEDRSDAAIPDSDGGVTWTLVRAPVLSITAFDPAVVNPERTTRIMVTTELAGCEDLAMPSVTIDQGAREVTVDMRAWRPQSTTCSGQTTMVQRPISLRLPTTGSWSVNYPEGRDPLTIMVEDAPARACDPDLAANCGMDCDCPSGQVCLGASGFIGPVTQCATPCELDRDCNGNGRCAIAPNGLSHYCDATQPECDDQNPCPRGYSCAGGSCAPDFVLGSDTRVACSGDQDCTEPLRCVEGTLPDRPPHCEIACPTENAAWCSTQHYCGPADQDTGGQAPADSVCVWAGE